MMEKTNLLTRLASVEPVELAADAVVAVEPSSFGSKWPKSFEHRIKGDLQSNRRSLDQLLHRSCGLMSLLFSMNGPFYTCHEKKTETEEKNVHRMDFLFQSMVKKIRAKQDLH